MISPKTILIIRWARLGDVVLSEPAVRLCRKLFPEAHISYLTGHRCAPVLKMVPAVDEIIALDRVALRDGNKISSIRRIFQFANEMRRRKFDLAIDLVGFRESELLVLWTGARWRVGLKRFRKPYWGFCFNLPPVTEDKSLLVAQMFCRVVQSLAPENPHPHTTGGRSSETAPEDRPPLPLGDPVTPRLKVPPAAEAMALQFWEQQGLLGLDEVYGFQMSASGEVRTWPVERFIELAGRVSSHARENGRRAGFVNFSAVHEAALCQRITRDMQADGNTAAAAIGGPDRAEAIPQLAALLNRCTAIVSNDTGPMHMSAAVGTPTLGLFSIGVTEHYRPLGAQCRFLKKNPLSQLSVDEVFTELIRMLE
ncbi:MAG: glycosyltransferase family 9 protein [Acidobacteriia bacterium]|nr:glycosyltransferase family 9 protein [Terriglobia bacterium]